MRLNWHQRLVGGLAVLLGLLTVASGVAVHKLSQDSALMDEVATSSSPYLQALQAAQLKAMTAAADERSFLLRGNPTFAGAFNERATAGRHHLAIAADLDGGAHAAEVAPLIASFDAWVAAVEGEIAAYDGAPDATVRQALGPNRQLRRTFDRRIDETVISARDQFVTEARAASDSARSGRRTMIALALVGLVTGVAVGYWLVVSVRRPVLAAREVLSAAANGDLTQRLEVSDDELGRLASAVNQLLENTSGTVSALASTAQRLNESSAALRGTSEGLAEDARETSSRATEAAASASAVGGTVESVAASTEQMGASIREIARSAEQASVVARDAVTAASDAGTTVARLDESSAEIGDVMVMIRSIAEQTNLLALNATIEAARAGAAGRGFAVVAGEVKELADETARAAQDVGARITSTRADIEQVVQGIRRISQVVDRIDELQTTIASAVEEQSVTTSGIAASVTAAAAGTQQIAGAVQVVAQSADGTGAGAAGTARAAAALSDLAAELGELVERFTVASRGPGAVD